jgi:hypothetical protein
MRKKTKILFNSLRFTLLLALVYFLFNSALDVYNNFAYDKAILKDSPYGYSPMLLNPRDYSSINHEIRSGEYVYVMDWLSAYNSRVVFAKVKSKLDEGYVNKDLLVQANMNVNPLVSSILLIMILIFSVRRVYKKYSSA